MFLCPRSQGLPGTKQLETIPTPLTTIAPSPRELFKLANPKLFTLPQLFCRVSHKHCKVDSGLDFPLTPYSFLPPDQDLVTTLWPCMACGDSLARTCESNTLLPSLVLTSCCYCTVHAVSSMKEVIPDELFAIWTFLEHMAHIIFLLLYILLESHWVHWYKADDSRLLLLIQSYTMGSLGYLWCVVTNQGKENQDIATKDNNNKTELGIHLRRKCSLHGHE